MCAIYGSRVVEGFAKTGVTLVRSFIFRADFFSGILPRTGRNPGFLRVQRLHRKMRRNGRCSRGAGALFSGSCATEATPATQDKRKRKLTRNVL